MFTKSIFEAFFYSNCSKNVKRTEAVSTATKKFRTPASNIPSAHDDCSGRSKKSLRALATKLMKRHTISHEQIILTFYNGHTILQYFIKISSQWCYNCFVRIGAIFRLFNFINCFFHFFRRKVFTIKDI